jgi:hypothetical protein
MVEVGKKTTLTLSEQSTEYYQDQAAEQVQQIYDSMLEKYRGNKDKEQGAQGALAVYYVHYHHSVEHYHSVV